MQPRVEYYHHTYENFADPVLAAIRRETFGEDIGQNSWLTADEYRGLIARLDLRAGQRVLEVACGSGGPAIFLARETGCFVIGVDSNEDAITTATQAAQSAGLGKRIEFQIADANHPLDFDPESFDAIVCVDAINHLADRLRVLRDWHRLLKPGGKILYTDPIIVTGALSNEEIAARSAIGFFLFVPRGENEKWIAQAGFRIVHTQDATSNAEHIAGRWHAARFRRRDELIQFEGAERFTGVQTFFSIVHRLSAERRLSRFAFIAEK